MTALRDHRVLAVDAAADSALARFFASLGADVQSTSIDRLPADLEGAQFLLDRIGLDGLAAAGCSRARIERINPGLIHVSVTPFGGGGPRSHWRGSELVASAMGGASSNNSKACEWREHRLMAGRASPLVTF